MPVEPTTPRRRTRFWVGLCTLAVLAVCCAVWVLHDLGPVSEPPPGVAAGHRDQGATTAPTAPDAVMPGSRVAVADPPKPAPEPGDEGATALVVEVVSPAPAAPVVGAAVEALLDGEVRGKGTTGDLGRVRLADLAAGSYCVVVRAQGHARTVLEDIAVATGRAATVRIELLPGVTFAVRVVDARDDRPLPGAGVTVEPGGALKGFASLESAPLHDFGSTDEAGLFRVRGVRDGELATVVVAVAAYREARVTVRPAGGRVPEDPVVVRLERGGTLTGTVRDADGRPVAGAEVFVVPAHAEQLRRNPRSQSFTGSTTLAALTARSGVDGAYRVTGLTPGAEYVALADAAGFARSPETARLRPDGAALDLRADFTLAAPAILVLRLVDEEGALVRDANVFIDTFLSGWSASSAGKDGTYRFAGLSGGEHVVNVVSAPFLDARQTFVAKPGGTSEVTVRLDPGAIISGVVVDGAGAPVSGVRAFADPDSGQGPDLNGRSGDTDAKGRFVVRGLGAGTYLLHARTIPFGQPDRPNWSTAGTVRADTRGKGVRLDVRLVAGRLGTARLRLRTPDGSPLPAQAGVSTRAGGSTSGSTQSLADETVRFTAFDGTEQTVEIRVAGYVPVVRTLRIDRGEDVDLGTVTLDPGLDLAGRVVDPEGRPVAGARVTHAGSPETVTDAEGRFVLQHLAAGPARVEVEAAGFLDLERELTAGQGAALPALVLRRGALLRGHLRDAQGAPLAAQAVALRLPPAAGSERGEWVDAAHTETDGAFSVRVPPGRYLLAREGEGRAVALGEVTLTEGETRELDLAVPEAKRR